MRKSGGAARSSGRTRSMFQANHAPAPMIPRTMSARTQRRRRRKTRGWSGSEIAGDPLHFPVAVARRLLAAAPVVFLRQGRRARVDGGAAGLCLGEGTCGLGARGLRSGVAASFSVMEILRPGLCCLTYGPSGASALPRRMKRP